ncbi:MAG: flagellar biosynthesis protein FlhB [Treponemataceae bacterium]
MSADKSLIIDLQWFAAEDEGKTETPSEFKLRKAREEGRVAKSAEIPAAIALIFVTLMLLIFSKFIFEKCLEVMVFFFHRCTTDEITPALFGIFMRYFSLLVLPIALVACIAIIAGYLIQFRGFIFSTKPIAPNFNKNSPNIFKYFKRTLFSSEGVFNLFKSLFKVACVAVIVFLVIKNNMEHLLTLLRSDVGHAAAFIAQLAIRILLYVAILFLVFSIADYFFQRKQFMDSLKMSKQEVKEEYKELEGDPRVKGQIKQRMQAILQQNAIKHVPEADVVITNPTHLAVALKYEDKKMEAPMVLAKGADRMAEQIKTIAREHDIPVIENKPLARAIYANVELGDMIPAEYYRAMSLVFAQVYRMNEAKKKR